MNNSFDGLALPQRIGAVVTVILGLIMAVLDGTITNVALPSISHSLHIADSASIWIINAYQLAIVMLLLPFSSLGERIGYRRIYLFGLVVFSLTSFMCSQASTLTELTIARVLQGIGAAALMSVSTALIRTIYPKKLLGQGMAINSLAVAASLAAGPTLAAAILAIANWPWLFAVNVPIGMIAAVIGHHFLPDNPIKGQQRFKLSALILNALSFGALMFALMGYAQQFSLIWVAISLLTFVIVSPLFIRTQRHLDAPLLPLDLLKLPMFRWSVITSILAFSSQMLAMVALPFYFQRILHLDQVQTGLLLTPWPIGTIVMAPLAGRWVNKVHGGILGGIGMFIFALGLLVCALLPLGVPMIFVGLSMFTCGVGFGFFQAPHNHTLISAAPTSRSGGASGMQSTARLVGQTFGAALVALLFNLFAGHGTHAALIAAGAFASIAILTSIYRVKLVKQYS
ncbi:MFS transporter [Celerinatantimonas diazotrophica]|uniref:DHA2 family multidrug resistance protein-like MFS transporter n=1 Tax=Celerinatantimonas diazotrophica TaxID=412034 RepID=A0A4R1JA27_9GAMM|nr:MFS transporter [Celerinatantimonas diazotrophica]TCK47472.1 DHA2 family multidrug resistance protein-like MFS transporter [Celerinatantimonas diazotrophica]CAG9296910.1 Riboflavin transporter RibZ [Celerinatantimonas diazotrophica]